jgi:histidine ammonia-lyase
MTVQLDARHLPLADVRRVAAGAAAGLGPQARARIQHAHTALQRCAGRGDALYGVNTGFGPFARTRVAPDAIEKLQVNLIRSHAVGYGDPLPVPVVRAMLVLRAHSLAHGFSGTSLDLVEALLALLTHDVIPCIPEKGSVGASGDLAPLAHIGLTLLGEGDVFHAGARMPCKTAFERTGLRPHAFGMKEGLALINGTQYMTAFGVLSNGEAQIVLHAATVAAAMSIEALLGTAAAFDGRIHALRRHAGQQAVAANLLRLLHGSPIVASHAACDAVQDAYSLRCTPQVLGASQDAIAHVERVLQDEADAVTDNPLVFPEDDHVVSGGNFHGQPVALVLDYLAVALAEVASLSERRLFQLLYTRNVPALPMCLSPNPGLESGLMMLQYLAAALVSETRTLSHPAALDNVVTGGGAEDHNSMGSVAALRLPRLLRNVRGVVAAELIAAARALDLHAPLAPGAATAAAHAVVRQHVAPLASDRVLAGDVEAVAAIDVLESIVRAAASAAGGALSIGSTSGDRS